MNSWMVTVSVSPASGSSAAPGAPQGGARAGAAAGFGEALEAATPAADSPGGGAGAPASTAGRGKDSLPGGKTLPPEDGKATASDDLQAAGASPPGETATTGPGGTPVETEGDPAATAAASVPGMEVPGKVVPDVATPGATTPGATTSDVATSAGTTSGVESPGEAAIARDGRAPAAADGAIPGLPAGETRGPVAGTPRAGTTAAFPSGQPAVPPTGTPGPRPASAPGVTAAAGAPAGTQPQDGVLPAMSGSTPGTGASDPLLPDAAAQREAARPDAARPDLARPDAARPDAARPDALRNPPAQAEGARLAAAIDALRADPAPAVRERMLLEGAQWAAETAADGLQTAPGKPGATAPNALATAGFSLPAAVDPLSPAAPRVAAGAAATLSPADPGFDLDLAGQVRIMVRDGQSEARLQLNPPELGRLDIRIATEGDQARVLFTVQGADARDAIEQALPRLREMLEQGGLQLSRFDVSDQSRQRHGEPGGFAPGEPGEAVAEESTARHAGLPGVARASHALVDYYV